MQTLPKEGTNGIAVLSATAHSQDRFSDQVTTNALSKDVKKAKAPPKRFIRQQVKTTWPIILSFPRSAIESDLGVELGFSWPIYPFECHV